jgi:hypothetical protein
MFCLKNRLLAGSSVTFVVYVMAFPLLWRSVVLSERRGVRDLVRDHRRQAYLMARGARVGGGRNTLPEWGHKHSSSPGVVLMANTLVLGLAWPGLA